MDIIHLHPLCIADSGVSLLGKLLEKYLMDSALAEFSLHRSFKASSINNFILIMEQMTGEQHKTSNNSNNNNLHLQSKLFKINVTKCFTKAVK